ncbi:RNA polymerase I-specific transcription initiation factor rrn7 [Penicillium rolfsii]|nr:RNA polymerase I-specific transcription initiation factor rrn7 [Penicillium rolfsii]
MEYVTRGVCGQEGCRERRYYLDNGLWFCRRGHLQEGRQIEEDPDDFGTQGKKHRVKKEKEERSRKTYRGRKAHTLFLQAYQLILWKQCHALIHDHGFPEQFEGVLRDLWALRLQDFTLRINAMTDDEEDDERELFSSQPETDSSDDLGFKSKGGRYLEWPRLLDSIGLCYLAAVLMRLPICVSDFHRLIIRQDIPYIRVAKSIPHEMKTKLPPEFLARLDVHQLPKSETFHRAFVDLMMHYQQRFGISLPPLNSTLILYRHIKRLAIPIDIYEAVTFLKGLLGFNFAFCTTTPGAKQKRILDLPEVQLMALIVVATKLLFPFDGLERHPTTGKEPAAQAINWSLWARAQNHFNDRENADGSIGKEKMIQLTDSDVLSMGPSQLDEYMDWYESNWIDGFRLVNPVADMFTTSRTTETPAPSQAVPPSFLTTNAGPEEALNSLIYTVMQELKTNDVNPDSEEDDRRPGSWYWRYRWEWQLPDTARLFHELAAELAAVSLQTLIHAVTVTEYKIAKTIEDKRRAEYFSHTMDLDMDGDAGEDSADGMDELDEQLTELDVGNVHDLQK